MSDTDSPAQPDTPPAPVSAPAPIRIPPPAADQPLQAAQPLGPDDFPGEVEMSLVDHLEELRRRVLRSLLAVVLASAGCLVLVRPLVRLLEVPAQGIRFLQLAPGEFLFVSLKVAGYAGLSLALPWVLYEGLGFVLPGLTRRERRLVAPAVAGSALLFAAGLAFAWWALVPAALRFLVSYGADVVEPLWSIERYLDFVLLLMVATALAFQLPVLQLLLAALGVVSAPAMLRAWRWVVLVAALAGAVLTPSTDPVTMLLLTGAITALYLVGVALAALAGACAQLRPAERWAARGSGRDGPGLDQEFRGPALGQLQRQGHGLAQPRAIAGGGEPLAHLGRHPQAIELPHQLLQPLGVGLGGHRKRLLLQVGPHHLQVETAAPHDQLQVVGGLPAAAQQLQHLSGTEGSGIGGSGAGFGSEEQGWLAVERKGLATACCRLAAGPGGAGPGG